MSFACVYTKQIPLENQQLFRWTVNNNITFHFGSMKRKIELSMLSLGMQFTHFNRVFFFSICVSKAFVYVLHLLLDMLWIFLCFAEKIRRNDCIQTYKHVVSLRWHQQRLRRCRQPRWKRLVKKKTHLKQKKWNEYGKCGCYDVCVRCYLLPMLFLLLQQTLMLSLPLYMCSFFR